MRMLLIGLGIVVAALAGDIRAGNAQRGYDNNFCIVNGVHGGGSTDCTYSTFEQCLASRSGNGGTCVANPYPGGERARSNGRSYRGDR